MLRVFMGKLREVITLITTVCMRLGVGLVWEEESEVTRVRELRQTFSLLTGPNSRLPMLLTLDNHSILFIGIVDLI